MNQYYESIYVACLEPKELTVLVILVEYVVERFDSLKSARVIKRIKIIGDKSVCE